MGIDEAGYGPLLGPLCVATSVFHMEEATEPQDLWELLSSAVCRSPKDSKGRVAPLAESHASTQADVSAASNALQDAASPAVPPAGTSPPVVVSEPGARRDDRG